MTTLQTTDGAPAAVALLGATGAIERATTLFLDHYGTGDEQLAAHQGEVDEILAGRVDRASVTLDDVSGELIAVVGPDGRRHALLTIQSGRVARDDRPNPLLADPVDESPIDESPAIVWLKDMDGHYLRVNRSFTEQLGVEADNVCGKTDAELSAKESIEGLRLRANDPVPQEPLELEYTVAAFDGRPAYAVLRFALRDGNGQPIAVCGVAAPLPQARTARAECERLMRIERWSRLDDRAIREELLDEWELAPADQIPDLTATRPGDSMPGDAASELVALAAERDAAVATAARLDQQLAEERREVTTLREASAHTARRAEDLTDAIAAEQARTEELERALARAETRLEALTGELEAERSEAERSGADAEEALGSERKAMKALRKELQAAQDALERMRGEELEAERRAAEALRAELRAAHEETERARLAAAEVAKQAPKREDIDQAKGQLDHVLDELAEAKEELERARADAAASAGTLAAEWETKEALQAELISAREELDGARQELDRTRAELEQARVAAAEAPTDDDLEQLRARAEEAQARAEEAEAAAVAAQAALADAQAAAAAAEEHAVAAEEHANEAERRAEEAEKAAQAALAEASAHAAELEQERGMIDSLRHELQRANADAATASAALAAERETVDVLHTELTAARDELAEQRNRLELAEGEAAESRARLEEDAARAASELEAMRQTVEELSTELTATREELAQLQAGIEPAEESVPEGQSGEPAAARHAWSTASQRALSAALAGAADWRAALKQAARVIGTEGGWEAVVAWAPDDGRGPMTCSAMWTADPTRLAGFENLTWQHRLDATGTEFGRARNRPGPTCLLELQTADDRMLRMAAEVGMGSALLLPIREGEKTIAILELLSSAGSPPDSELMVALEAVALQLSGVGQALNTTHWNLGSRL